MVFGPFEGRKGGRQVVAIVHKEAAASSLSGHLTAASTSLSSRRLGPWSTSAEVSRRGSSDRAAGGNCRIRRKATRVGCCGWLEKRRSGRTRTRSEG